MENLTTYYKIFVGIEQKSTWLKTWNKLFCEMFKLILTVESPPGINGWVFQSGRDRK